MILSYMTSRTVYTGVFRVACDIFQVACDFFEIEHCSISKKSHMILVYLNSKKVSIIRLLQRVHSETKVSYDFVIYYKS